MDATRASKAVPIILLFGALAASAATGFPRDDGDMPRGARALDFVVRTFGTDHFGPTGGAVHFAVLGLLLAGLVMIGPRDESRKASARQSRSRQRKREREDAAIDLGSRPPAPRRRSIAAQTAAPAEHHAVHRSPPPRLAKAVAGPRPAWGLMLASPWSAESDYTSWLGGLPCAPADFEWPRDAADGEPMHFYAQIDLAGLRSEPVTGASAPGLPETGAMLVFMGHGCAVRIIGAHEMEDAQPVAAPGDLPSVRKFGFWFDGNVFPFWPVVPRAFVDHGYDEETYVDEPPAAFPDPHRNPADWITNWGIAALEADTTLTTLGHEIRNAQWALNYQLNKLAGQRAGAAADDDRLREEAFGALDSYRRLLLTEGPTIVGELEAWKSRAENSDPMDPVDTGALAQLFEKRIAFCAREQQNYSGTMALLGSPSKLWERIGFVAAGDAGFLAFRELPEPYRRFAEERITGWRRHRLFGFEPPFPNNWEDLDGKAPLISIGADQLLGTQTEHEYGLSLWGPTADLEAGRYDRLEVVRHCAV